MTIKTTVAEFEFFKSEIRYYQKKLGLINWFLNMRHKPIENCAEIDPDLPSMSVKITFATTSNIKYNKAELSDSAFHEVCEILLYQLEETDEQKTHEVIARLTNAFWRDDFKRRFPKETITN